MASLQYILDILGDVTEWGIISIDLEGEAPARLRVEFASAPQCSEATSILDLFFDNPVHKPHPTVIFIDDI